VVLTVLPSGEPVPAAARGVLGEDGKTSQPDKKQHICGEVGCFLHQLCKSSLANR